MIAVRRRFATSAELLHAAGGARRRHGSYRTSSRAAADACVRQTQLPTPETVSERCPVDASSIIRCGLADRWAGAESSASNGATAAQLIADVEGQRP